MPLSSSHLSQDWKICSAECTRQRMYKLVTQIFQNFADIIMCVTPIFILRITCLCIWIMTTQFYISRENLLPEWRDYTRLKLQISRMTAKKYQWPVNKLIIKTFKKKQDQQHHLRLNFTYLMLSISFYQGICHALCKSRTSLFFSGRHLFKNLRARTEIQHNLVNN